MMDVVVRKSRAIRSIYEQDRALFLESEHGLIRIWPQTDRIIRVSYTENGVFPENQGEEYEDLSGKEKRAAWTWSEGQEILVQTEELRVRVNRETGSLIYEEKDGSLLLAEADAMSKQVEEFPYFRPVDGEAQIKTVDGVKQKVLETAREYDRMLYHTRLSLKFNEPAGQVKWLFYCPTGSPNLTLRSVYCNRSGLFSLNLIKGIDDRNGGYDNTKGRVLKSIDSDGTISKNWKERCTMVKPIMKDIFFLGQKSEKATRADLQVGKDLEDTLEANREGCVGMAANMIGVKKRVIIVNMGLVDLVMFNPVLLKADTPYEAEEGCLSLVGVRKTTRYQNIEVEYTDKNWNKKRIKLSGWYAQICQHELDHLDGIII